MYIEKIYKSRDGGIAWRSRLHKKARKHPSCPRCQQLITGHFANVRHFNFDTEEFNDFWTCRIYDVTEPHNHD